MNLTPGEYAMMTGLSAKALRLYGERGILTPATVDTSSGHRQYSRSQLRHGMVVDSLRRAKVPLTQLAHASDFDFTRWREEVEMKRHMEDFYLAIAERISSFDPADLVPRVAEAPAMDWIGVSIHLDIPDDVEGALGTFAGLAFETPRIYAAFTDALDTLGVPPADICWTGAPDGTSAQEPRMLMARPAPSEPIDMTLVEKHLVKATSRPVTVCAGSLPRRDEITFTPASERPATAGAPNETAIDEAASSHLHLLAFEALRRDRALEPVGRGARVVVHGASMFATDDTSIPVDVFDVLPTR